jgi:hypothetical protein
LKDPLDNEQMMQLLVLLMDAARGIAALHSKSVVHGDGEHTPYPVPLRLAFDRTMLLHPLMLVGVEVPWCDVTWARH